MKGMSWKACQDLVMNVDKLADQNMTVALSLWFANVRACIYMLTKKWDMQKVEVHVMGDSALYGAQPQMRMWHAYSVQPPC